MSTSYKQTSHHFTVLTNLFFQFQSLFTMGSAEVALTSLCLRPVDTYLKSPAEASIDLQVILSQFCQTNWTIVAEEVMSDVSIDAILAEVRVLRHFAHDKSDISLFNHPNPMIRCKISWKVYSMLSKSGLCCRCNSICFSAQQHCTCEYVAAILPI